MHCSSFESRLDAYVEGSLVPRENAAVAAHLATCEACTHLLAELRRIDALLVTRTEIALPPNFTFATMAEIRALPPPQRRANSLPPLIAAYLVFAWLVIGMWFSVGGPAAHAALALVTGSLGRSYDVLQRLVALSSKLFGHATFQVTAAMTALLTFDVFFAVLIALVYSVVRPRLRAHISGEERLR